jgi:hypothetical protein
MTSLGQIGTGTWITYAITRGQCLGQYNTRMAIPTISQTSSGEVMRYEHSVVQIVDDAFDQILSELEVAQMIE